MQQWAFVQDDSGGWCWRCFDDDAQTASDRTFESRTDCLVDAMRHGYLSTTASLGLP